MASPAAAATPAGSSDDADFNRDDDVKVASSLMKGAPVSEIMSGRVVFRLQEMANIRTHNHAQSSVAGTTPEFCTKASSPSSSASPTTSMMRTRLLSRTF